MGKDARGLRGVCLFGGHHAGYPRSAVLFAGLERLGVPVVGCVVPPRYKAPRRYALLLSRWLKVDRSFDVLFVPEFRHKDVPLASALAGAGGKLCVFDPLVSRYDTRVHDRRDVGRAGPQAWHNRNIDRISMSLPDMVIADTGAHAEYFRRQLAPPGARVRVIEVGYDDAMFRPSPEEPGAPVRILFYGSYLPLHGVHVIVEAARILRDREDVEFEIIGAGQTFDDVQMRVREYSLERVSLHGRVPASELPRRIRAAHVCLGIFGETEKAARVVPNKVFQCMGAGRAVITADTAGVRGVFEDGEELVLVPAGDAEALAEAISALAGDRRRRARIAGRAAARVQRDFSPEPLARRFVQYCLEAMD